ncbi:MAG: hypothetical protein H0T73_04680, partial [Ardenticatenales bacterium]|nr:hypothetical protein [Ardenticatenales bacterium]
YAPALLATALFVSIVRWGVGHLAAFPVGMPQDAIETGYYLNEVLSQEDSGEANYLLEWKRWDFLAVQLIAGHYDAMHFDRVPDVYTVNSSLLDSQEPTDVYESLLSQKIRYVVLYHPELKAQARLTGFLHARQEIGNWTIYEFRPTP